MTNKIYISNFLLAIKTYMATNNITTPQMAKKLDCSTDLLYKYLDGKNPPSLTLILKVIELLNLSPNWLFLNIEPMYLETSITLKNIQFSINEIKNILLQIGTQNNKKNTKNG